VVQAWKAGSWTVSTVESCALNDSIFSAWNEGGIVECSFPYNKVELSGKRELGGQIQILQYKSDHNAVGFWYSWIPFKERSAKAETERQLVRCGQSMPILWTSRPRGALLGDYDMQSGVARFSYDKKAEEVKGDALDDMLIIARELVGG
jgi:hypothetical protein